VADTKSKRKKQRILIVDDHPMMRQGLAQLIDTEPDLSVQGEADNAKQALEAVASRKPDLVLLGTGATLRFPRPELTRSLYAARIGLEVMDNPAVCRTYNILLAEGRNVIAAVLLGPVLPERAAETLRRLSCPPGDTRLTWGGLTPGTPVTSGEPLFPRME